MTRDERRYALAAARLLREQWPEGPAAEGESRRDQVVAAMELDLALHRRRRRNLVGAVLVMAAAATIVVGVKLTGAGGDAKLVVKHALGPKNLLLRAASTQPLSPSAVLLAGDDVRCDDGGGATLGFARGTQLTLSSSSHLRVDELGRTRRFSLFRGRVDAEVPKLAPDERFIVGTPDGEVEVRGTSFSVDVADSPAGCSVSRTRSTVKVREGAVWVRSMNEAALLGPGESWSAPCAEPATVTRDALPAAAGAAAAPASSTAVPRSPARKSSQAAPSAPEWKLTPQGESNDRAALPVSHLAEQNDLLSAAMKAERAGRHGLALSKLDDLIGRFPQGPLLETARIERQRIMSARTPPSGER
jgi:ferric-dicitrate binding protein FerR (iron transport regulator)